ncbi:MAG: large conductance mechanosensitive channel protein MscL [Myxococcales bacterium]|nr:large conductance mechanosensitive channel protein MscL [Myxococcales bacterium]
MMKEFKEFAVKGNMVDMAVGIMIGAAFNGVVKSIVDDIIMPPLGLLTGNLDFSDKFFILKNGSPEAPYATLAQAKAAGAVVMSYGQLISQLVSFLIIAFVLFMIVRWINRLRKQPEAVPNAKLCPFCKSSIDVAASRCAFCTSDLKND